MKDSAHEAGVPQGDRPARSCRSSLDLPVPHVGPDQVLVQSHYSLISSGTEMGTLKKTPAELVQADDLRSVDAATWSSRPCSRRARARPARRVWHEMITPREIGYSGAGHRAGARGPGGGASRSARPSPTRPAVTPRWPRPTINHVVPVPDGVDLRHAAFVTVGGIAMQSLRRADLQFGETVAIYGLGLVGQLCAAHRHGGRLRGGRDRHQPEGERAGHGGRRGAGGQPDRARVEAAHPRLHRQERRRRHDHLRQLRFARRSSTRRWRSPGGRAGWCWSATSSSTSTRRTSCTARSTCATRAPTGRAATTPATRRAASTTRSGTSAGPRSATSRSSSAWSQRAPSTPSR